ncbi:hypothetical protein [Brevibacillus daliensis]|uniref:hypothetical protein n=1 Tax=Brevibacillus daliensis TaxID=2892995 RepID=UPI001E496ABE|nr:hypothetical protein [Brevibacillus daliensis]
MNSLEFYVDHLFRKYKASIQIQDLRFEVLGNLEAKVADLTANGVGYDEAVRMAKENLPSIDHLIDGNRTIYINQFRLEYVQITLLYMVIGWIVAMPLQFIRTGFIHWLFLISSAIIGVVYLVLLANRKNINMQKIKAFNLNAVFDLRKQVWLVWFIFIGMSIFITTALQFGSNIWFFRPVDISGPYQFAMIAIKYLIPFASIIVPVIFHIAPKLIMKYEVGENDGYKE